MLIEGGKTRGSGISVLLLSRCLHLCSANRKSLLTLVDGRSQRRSVRVGRTIGAGGYDTGSSWVGSTVGEGSYTLSSGTRDGQESQSGNGRDLGEHNDGDRGRWRGRSW